MMSGHKAPKKRMGAFRKFWMVVVCPGVVAWIFAGIAVFLLNGEGGDTMLTGAAVAAAVSYVLALAIFLRLCRIIEAGGPRGYAETKRPKTVPKSQLHVPTQRHRRRGIIAAILSAGLYMGATVVTVGVALEFLDIGSEVRLHAQRAWPQEGPPRGPAGDVAPKEG